MSGQLPKPAGGMTRVRVIGSLSREKEVLFIARHEPHWPARHAEVEITDYSGIGRWYDHQDVWYVKNDRTPPGRYEARRLIDADDGWCVVATPSEAVAGIHFGRRGQATTTESEARAWAEALNLKFPTA